MQEDPQCLLGSLTQHATKGEKVGSKLYILSNFQKMKIKDRPRNTRFFDCEIHGSNKSFSREL